jgi:hypothetical protein
MMTIYLDGSAALEPGAADQLIHLAEAGHELVLVAPPDQPVSTKGPWARRVATLPDEVAGAWFVTSDPGRCGDRRPGLRSLLIGPRGDGPWPTRCDATARDLRDAVLELLATDAMR